MPKICILGLGYIGLPTASVLATSGLEVLGVDVSEGVVNTINSGNIHIEEPGLDMIVRAAVQSGNLRAALTPEAADTFIIAVPTPFHDGKKADMSYVEKAVKSILPFIEPGCLVILESTSPPGTCTDFLKPILETTGLRVGEDIYLAHCPERVLPGKILKELLENDRVLGGINLASAEQARDLYAHFVEGELFLTDCTTAEVAKLVENTYRDVNIALANEVASMCEKLGISVWELAPLVNRHPRVHFHDAGPGVGGHCISVDPWFLVEKHPECAKLIHLARTTNDAMPAHVAGGVLELVSGVDRPKVALWGMAYKADVDDIRESPALAVAEQLLERNVEIAFYDPHVGESAFDLVNLEDSVRDADCVVLLTDHREYADIKPRDVAGTMRTRTLYDTRNALAHDQWREAGFTVRVLGSGKPG